LLIIAKFTVTGEINGNAMTPSARVSAINIVGDLLRKVGVSEFNIFPILFPAVVVSIVVLFFVEI
jgi:hypothetical protein